MACPPMTRCTKRVPAALVLNFPVEVLWRVVLTDLIAVAVTAPPSTLTCCVVAELVEAMPVRVAFDATFVSIVPEKSTFGTCADATVFEWVIPITDVQLSGTKAEGPDFIMLPTRTEVPQAVAWNEYSCVEADAVETPNASAAIATPLSSRALRVKNSSGLRRCLVARRSSRRV